MTALDRLIAAICDDDPRVRREQFELVKDLLRQGHRLRAGAATSSVPNPVPLIPGSPAVALTEKVWHCPNCLRDWREPFCEECGRNLMGGTDV